MAWNPDLYNQFKTLRNQPFYDLMAMIAPNGLQDGIDLGCGTGEQTSLLAQHFGGARFLGIDASNEMLAQSGAFANKHLTFRRETMEDFAADASSWDLIFSNAALQWADQHEQLFPQLIAKLNPGGQFAVQMPCQHDNILNQLLLDIVRQEPFVSQLQGFARVSPMLTLDQYCDILFRGNLVGIQACIKVYPMIAKDARELLDFISGSALIPYMERLDAPQREALRTEFLKRIEQRFGSFPAIYPFKRMLLYGRKPQ